MKYSFVLSAISCKPACRTQENSNQMSFGPYPQRQRFFHQLGFCNTASHIWQISCQNENKKYIFDARHPKLCSALKEFDKYFGKESSCRKWPKNYFEDHSKLNETLLEEMFEYGKENLALVRIFIPSPYVTLMKRDVAMTFINYIANTGGLLGLCLGFSFISAFEIFYWICICCQLFVKKTWTAPE